MVYTCNNILYVVVEEPISISQTRKKHTHIHTQGGFRWSSVSITMQTGSGFFSVQSQIRQQEEVEKKAEVAMEMSDLVVYCQPRSKEKDRFGKHMQMHRMNPNTCEHKQHNGVTRA